MYLPASRGGESKKPEAIATAGRGTGKVLLMDDDGLVRDVAAQMIASLGHEVTTAANGEEAIGLFLGARKAGNPFDIVVLDLTVKNGMGGEETIRRLREIDPARQGGRVERVLGFCRAGRIPVVRLLRQPEQAVPAGRLEGLPLLPDATVG